MKKTFIKIILIFCSSSISLAANTLTIWTSSENVKDSITTMANAFEKDYKAKVEINVLNKDLTSQFKTAALTGKGPDIFAWAHDVIGELASSGLIEPITLPKKLQKELLPVAVSAFTYQGKVYGYPYDLEAVALIYNKSFIKTPPSTMKELITIAQKFNDPTKKTYGFLYDVGNFFFSFPLLSAGGGYIYKDNNGKLDVNDVGLANAGAISGGNFIQSLIEKNIMPSSTDYSISMEKMKEGLLAMTINGPWAIKDLKKSNIDYGISTIPTLNGSRPKPFVGTHGFIIRRSSQNKKLAKEFIENYLVSKEGILSLYEADPRGPSRKDVLEILSKKDNDLKEFMNSAKDGIPMPNVPEMSIVWNTMGNALKLMISGQLKAKEALAQAKKQILSSLKSKNK